MQDKVRTKRVSMPPVHVESERDGLVTKMIIRLRTSGVS
jgi:hypothetical protein